MRRHAIDHDHEYGPAEPSWLRPDCYQQACTVPGCKWRRHIGYGSTRETGDDR